MSPITSPTDRPSIKDVASLAGVSLGTVSQVLNHPERVTERTRNRVMKAIKELGYVRSEAARRLRRGTSPLVGVLVHDISNPSFSEALRGIEDRLRARGLTPILGSTESETTQTRRLIEQFAGLGVRGVIHTPSTSTLKHLNILTDRGIRIVLMNSPAISDDYSNVSGDDVAGARIAVTHLLERGHRRIGFINCHSSALQSIDRRAGVLEALTNAGLNANECLIELEAVTNDAGLTADAGEMNASVLLDTPNAPTAIFCATDQLAIGAMREIRRRNLAIPEDIAVIGYDDIEVASELITPLTSIHMPLRSIGETAADLLLSEDSAVRHVFFEPELIVRASTDSRH